MMSKWFMVTLVGQDRPGIVAHVTGALYEGGCNLGETSMLRIGGNFTVMMMVAFDGRSKQLQDMLSTVADSMGLHIHVDQIDGKLHQHLLPDVLITVYGADQAGIVAKVTAALAEAGLHITDLESDVGGSEEKPLYIMHIEGHASEGIEALQSALDIVKTEKHIDAKLQQIETLIG